MFFLLPPKPVSDPIVANFRQTLSQVNEVNYHTVPLYNLRGAAKEAESSMQIEPRNEPKFVSKSVPTASKKSNVATKSKPAGPASIPVPPVVVPKCQNCGWPFPETMVTEDQDLHSIRCKNGFGEQDQMVWIRCKGNRVDYRRIFEEVLPKKKEKEKAEKEKPGKPVKPLSAKKAAKMETEPQEEPEAKKIKKKKDTKESKETKPVVIIETASTPTTQQTKKRKNPLPSKDVSSEQSDPMVKDNLKKVKKDNLVEEPGPSVKINASDSMQGKVRKTGQKKVINLLKANGLVFDPTQVFSQFSSKEEK